MNTNDALPYKPIRCSDYDYLEIACMDHYEIELRLRNEPLRDELSDTPLRGIAKTLLTQYGEEFLLITDRRCKDLSIRVDTIERLRVLTRPARFTEIQFE